MTKTFIRTRSSRDLIVSILMVLAGTGTTIFVHHVSIQFIGFFLLVIGLILLFTLKSVYKDLETGEKFRKVVRYFEIGRKDAILQALAGDPSKIDRAQEGKGNGVLLEIFYNGEHAYVQPYGFASFEYQPCGDLYHFKAAQVEQLIRK